MSGALLAQARKDAVKFAAAGGFQVDITISTPDGSSELAVTGLTTDHWISFDTDGNPVNSRSGHINIPEHLLIDGGYPYRNAYGEVSLGMPKPHNVVVNGVKYVINECHPNGTLGWMVCILGKCKQ